MSFARKVKEEIKEQIDKKRHCQIAELAAYFAFIGSVVMTEEGGYEIHFHTENLTVLQKSYILFRKAFRTTPDISVRGEHQYSLYILDEDIAQQFIEAVWLQSGSVLVADPVVERVCCRRAFLRGTFLTGGSVTDPNSGYGRKQGKSRKSLPADPVISGRSKDCRTENELHCVYERGGGYR